MENRTHWYAIYTKSRCEKKVEEYLRACGVRTYLPIKKELHKWSDRKKLVEVPMINSYCFVRIDIAEEKDRIYAAPGFVAFVCDHGKPCPIPQSEMDMMKKTVDSTLEIQVEMRRLRVGKKVRILTGPMTGTIGTIDQLNKNKVYIHLEVIGITMIVDLKDEPVFETYIEKDEDEES
ncbi:MAG: UpxY family transcription antiterminator [Bacteroidales bacterium]|nr:UpxY family transcription antiterminator [Bacteroidales bacterium]